MGWISDSKRKLKLDRAKMQNGTAPPENIVPILGTLTLPIHQLQFPVGILMVCQRRVYLQVVVVEVMGFRRGGSSSEARSSPLAFTWGEGP